MQVVLSKTDTFDINIITLEFLRQSYPTAKLHDCTIFVMRQLSIQLEEWVRMYMIVSMYLYINCAEHMGVTAKYCTPAMQVNVNKMNACI